MKNKTFTSLIITVPLLLNVGFATMVHACSTNNTEGAIPITYISPSANIETKLNDLVALEDISQAQETTILNMFYTDEITTTPDFTKQLDTLVTKDTVTQNQEHIILSLFPTD
ncbi:hypothetical protein ACJDU8_24480 [Clostridium sp. WILCCON 0269]|uniref:Inhibitor I9 domain-containing protein n=1 Tax=Candidatus Clostridium eludens TaxID=3381663 RepID=A0ABW8SS96_9CLOT